MRRQRPQKIGRGERLPFLQEKETMSYTRSSEYPIRLITSRRRTNSFIETVTLMCMRWKVLADCQFLFPCIFLFLTWKIFSHALMDCCLQEEWISNLVSMENRNTHPSVWSIHN